jgi:hypothetical protein
LKTRIQPLARPGLLNSCRIVSTPFSMRANEELQIIRL